MGTFIETINGYPLIIKEEGDTKVDDSSVQSDLWDRWVMDVYHLVLPHKVKRSHEGLCVLCIMWSKRKVVHGIFNWLEENYGGFDSTHEGETLRGEWATGRRRESRRDGKVKATKSEIDLIDLRDTLPRAQAASWREWEDI